MPIFCQKNAKCLKNTLFSCPCFVKKTSILSKTRCSHVIFFKFFMEKSLPVMPMFSQKNVNSVKTIGQKVNRIPIFFPNFHDKILLSWPYSIKKRPFSNKRTVLTPIFCQKSVHSLKNTVFSRHFFKSFIKNPCCNAHIWSANVNSVKISLLYKPKSQWDAPFSKYLSWKNDFSYALILSKKCQFSKKTLLSCPYFIKKHSLKNTTIPCLFFSNKRDLLSCPYFVKKTLFSKNTAIPCLFFRIFIQNRNTVMPKSGQKNVNSVKTILSYGPKKLKWSPCFPILNEKATLFKPILCWKNVHSLKSTMHLCQYFVKSTSIFSKLWCSHVIVSIIS